MLNVAENWWGSPPSQTSAEKEGGKGAKGKGKKTAEGVTVQTDSDSDSDSSDADKRVEVHGVKAHRVDGTTVLF